MRANGSVIIGELADCSNYGVQEYGTTGWDADPNYTAQLTNATYRTARPSLPLSPGPSAVQSPSCAVLHSLESQAQLVPELAWQQLQFSKRTIGQGQRRRVQSPLDQPPRDTE